MGLLDDVSLDLSKDITPEDEDKKDKLDDEDSSGEGTDDATDQKDEKAEDDSAEGSDANDSKDTDDGDSDKPDGDGDGSSDDDKDDKDQKNIPFHEHPDWKKMQERAKKAEDDLAKLKRDQERADEIRRSAEDKKEENPEDQLTPGQLAVKRIRDKVAKKEIEPKDQAEITALVNEEMDAIKAERTAKQTQVIEQRKAAAAKEIEDTFTKLNITDDKDQEKIMAQVLAWKNNGMTVSVGTIEVATDHLKLQGKLGDGGQNGEPPKPKQTDDSKEKEAKDKAARDDVNRKMKKKGSADGKGGTTKKSYSKLRSMSLDDIVLEQGEMLDSK